MAFTYPLDLPASARISSQPRMVDWGDAYNPNRGGRPSGVNVASPLWTVDYETSELTEAELFEWEVWYNSLKGVAGYFKAIHTGRKYPRTYPTGFDGLLIYGTADPFLGVGTIDNIVTSTQRFRLNGLPRPPVFYLVKGDCVSVASATGGRRLFQLSADVNSNATGQATLLDVLPLVTTEIASGAAYTLVDPWFEAVVIPGSWQIIEKKGREGLSRRVSFKAVEVKR